MCGKQTVGGEVSWWVMLGHKPGWGSGGGETQADSGYISKVESTGCGEQSEVGVGENKGQKRMLGFGGAPGGWGSR